MDETVQAIMENEDELKALQKAKFLLSFSNDEKEFLSTEDDTKSEEAD